MIAGFPSIQRYGRQQRHTLYDQTASNKWPTHTEAEGAVLLTRMLSLVRFSTFSLLRIEGKR
jgi:hypothetical protein